MRTKKINRLIVTIFYGLILASLAIRVPYAAEQKSQTNEPKGTINIGVQGMGGEIWPGVKTEYTVQSLVMGVYESLLRADKDGDLVPCLAEKWERSPDGMKWTFDLRKGIPFHDGWGEFTAEDVKFSYEQAILPDSLCVQKSFYINAVESVEIVNQYRVVWHMKKPDWALPNKLVQYSPSFFMISKKYFETKGEAEASKHPIGTGPFKFVDHKLGQTITLEAVENHWRKTPEVKTVIINKVPEMATMLSMYKRGKLDIFDIIPEYIPEAESAGAKIWAPPTHGLVLCLMGQYLPNREGYDPKLPWAPHLNEPHDWRNPETLSEWNKRSLKVRTALAMAIDMDSIVKNVLMGYGERMANSIYWPTYPGANPDWKPIAYDPEKARELLADAGYKPGDIKVKMALAFHISAINMPVSEAIAMYWTKLGIQVDTETIDYGSVFKPKAHDRKMAGYAYVSRNAYSSEYVLYMIYVGTSFGWYGWQFEDPWFDEMHNKAMAELNGDIRAQIQREMGDYVYAGVLSIPVAFVPTLEATSAKITDWPLSVMSAYPTGELEYLKLHD